MKTWIKVVLGILVAIIVLPLPISYIVYRATGCFDMDCFDEFAAECEYVEVFVEKPYGEVEYEVRHDYDTDECYLTTTIIEMNKSLYCPYKEGDYNPEWSASWLELDGCTGDLKDMIADMVLFV